MITEHFRQVPSFRCMSWADPEGGQGVRTPLKNHKNIGFPSKYWSGSPKNHKATKPAFNGGPSTRQQNAISKAFRWWADGGPFLVAFWSSLTTPSDKIFWIRACMQCIWTGSIEIKLVLTTCVNDTDEPAQVCILNSALMALVCQASPLLCWMD